MRTTFKPSKIVAGLLFAIITIATYISAWLFIDSAKDGNFLVIAQGVLFLVVAAMLSHTAIRGLSTRIDTNGVSQMVPTSAGRITRRYIAWNEVASVTRRGYVLSLVSRNVTTRINLALFDDMAEVTNFIQSRCPTGSDDA